MAPVAVAGHERKTARRKAKPDVRARRYDAGGIEIEAEGVTIRVGRGAGRGDDCGHRPCTEGKPVIGPSGTVRVMVATKPVDFRKGMEGLAWRVR